MKYIFRGLMYGLTIGLSVIAIGNLMFQQNFDSSSIGLTIIFALASYITYKTQEVTLCE